jgi:hypothetical protein
MMARCGWGTKEDQEAVLAVRLRRPAFEAILAEAVPSAFTQPRYADPSAWKHALARSQVRLQWDPDHDPAGARVERRALQLGLRGEFLARYAGEWIAGIEDVTGFVAAQRVHALSGDWPRLETPREEVYPLPPALAAQIGADT